MLSWGKYRKTKNLTIVRDRFGEKPLYWTTIDFQGQKTFIFASDLKGIINLIPEYPKISESITDFTIIAGI